MHPMLNIAIQAIRHVGTFIIKQYEIFNINNKQTTKYKNNLLIKINKKSNQLIENIIKKYYPSHIITTQNNYIPKQINDEIQWIINPLDSQTNFIKHLPYFASSIIVKIKGKIELAVIYDPIHNDLFSASRGQGTQLNGYRIHHTYMTKKISYKESIVTYFPYHKAHTITNILNKVYDEQNKNFRYSGAITLDLAYVAVGRIDVLFAINIKTQKIEGGSLLIKESGGLILNLNKNNKNDPAYINIIAGNPQLIKVITTKIPILKKYY